MISNCFRIAKKLAMFLLGIIVYTAGILHSICKIKNKKLKNVDPVWEVTKKRNSNFAIKRFTNDICIQSLDGYMANIHSPQSSYVNCEFL